MKVWCQDFLFIMLCTAEQTESWRFTFVPSHRSDKRDLHTFTKMRIHMHVLFSEMMNT